MTLLVSVSPSNVLGTSYNYQIIERIVSAGIHFSCESPIKTLSNVQLPWMEENI